MALNFWPFKKSQSEPFVEANGKTVYDDEDGWRRITGDAARNLDPMTQTRMQDLAAYTWKSNPLGNRLIELPVAFILGEGVSWRVEDEDAQGWLDAFWRDPINNMDIKLAKKVRELALFGEQCWPVAVNEMNGHVRLGYLDPSRIATVVTDPDNVEQVIGIITKRDKRNRVKRYRVIINGPEDVFGEAARRARETFTDGDCFYFTVNDLSSASRGHSDLMPQLDWLDALEHSMFGEIERWDFLRAFIWQVVIKGGTPEDVDLKSRQISTPAPGSVRVTNENEEWKVVTPDLGAYESATNARLFRGHIMGGATIPEHWFGNGGDVNRATAGEMGEPTFKVLAQRQRFIGYVLREIGTYVIRQRLSAYFGSELRLEDNPEYAVTVDFPELTSRDTSKYAASFQQVVSASLLAIDRGILSEASAVRMLALVAGQLGLELDPTQELEAAKEEAAKRQEQDGFPGFEDDASDGQTE